MTRLSIAVVAALAMLLMTTSVASAAATAPYRTDAQAAHHLEQLLGSSWFCLNGYYSAREQRTGRHFPSRDERFRSFTCVSGGPALYLQTRPHSRWVIMRDR